MAAKRKKPASRRGRYDRTQSRKEREAEVHRRLLDAAAQTFAEVGYRAANVEAIVARAAISRRTFYEHFDDLDDALGQVHLDLGAQAFGLLELAIGLAEDPLEKVRLGVSAFMTAVAQNGGLARVIFREVRAAGPKFELRWQQENARYVSLLLGALEAAHRAGALRFAPTEVEVFTLIVGIEQVAIRHLARGDEHLLVDLAPALAELVLRAFR